MGPGPWALDPGHWTLVLDSGLLELRVQSRVQSKFNIPLTRNGYPNGIIAYNMNDVVNKQQNKPQDPITSVPKKKSSSFCPIKDSKVK